MKLLLRGLRTMTHGTPRDLRIAGRRLAEIGRGLAPKAGEQVLELDGYLALPGLINAHDHLSLNLLPRLGDPPYPNLYAFADANYQPEASPIREVMHQTRVRDRLWWGGYKNLIVGATTVAHHDPFTHRVFHRRFPVKVVRRYGWSHSLRFGPNPGSAYRRSRGKPFIIHAAEGIDEIAGGEIDQLDDLGALGPNTVLIHGIAIDARQRARLADAGCSVVWCPASNAWLYQATAPIRSLMQGLDVALGTDSTMSGAPTLLDEMRAASATGEADAGQILEMVTAAPARMFHLRDGRGGLVVGGPADLVLLPDRGAAPADNVLNARPRDPALVLIDGDPRRATPRLAATLGLGDPNAWVDTAPCWLYGDVAGLRRRLQRDAGETVLARNPLWSMLRASPPPS